MDKSKYLQLIQPAMDLVVEKHKDYQSGGTELQSYFPFGDASHVQMIHIKSLRLVSLVRADKVPEFEKVRDSVLDLINYGVFYLDYLRGQGDE